MLSSIYCGFIILLICFGKSLAISDELREMVQMLHDTCIEETGAKEDQIVRARTGDFDDDHNLKCYMKCFLDQISALTDDGDIDVEAISGMLPGEMADLIPAIEACGTVKGADDCETAYLTNKCWYDKVKDRYYLI